MGGQYRARYQGEQNMRGLGLTGIDDNFLLHRTRLFMNAKYGDSFRGYVEYIDAQSNYENFPIRIIEENRSDLLELVCRCPPGRRLLRRSLVSRWPPRTALRLGTAHFAARLGEYPPHVRGLQVHVARPGLERGCLRHAARVSRSDSFRQPRIEGRFLRRLGDLQGDSERNDRPVRPAVQQRSRRGRPAQQLPLYHARRAVARQRRTLALGGRGGRAVRPQHRRQRPRGRLRHRRRRPQVG